ncbi:hypothetical protein B0H16DRAFT_1470389 [Mycena metata]|uniref:Uncharacterized protein n=1 Tax=Mycena metata TaxID=1033252 RepID=A0AAD7HUF2_9AGAR|nr:hypothetical protein B0H16DRAFT_1470389 [Mycena metata]
MRGRRRVEGFEFLKLLEGGRWEDLCVIPNFDEVAKGEWQKEKKGGGAPVRLGFEPFQVTMPILFSHTRQSTTTAVEFHAYCNFVQGARKGEEESSLVGGPHLQQLQLSRMQSAVGAPVRLGVGPFAVILYNSFFAHPASAYITSSVEFQVKCYPQIWVGVTIAR